jgi:hypothetical protein
VQPAHPLGTGLGAGHVEAGAGRIDRGHLDAPPGERAGERARATADVEHGAGPELLGQLDVDVEVAAVRVERVVDLCEPWILEDGVGHPPIVAPSRRS